MAFLLKDINEMINNAVAKLTTSTALTDLGPNSYLRQLLSVLYSDLDNLQTSFLLNETGNFISNASGSDLDKIALLFGLRRNSANRSIIVAGAKNFKFYVKTGTFGSINGSSSIIVPTGTKIYTESTPVVTYTTIEEITLPSGSTEFYFSASADTNGTGGNVNGTNILNQHNFVNYVDRDNASLLVTNVYPVTIGVDRETDSAFRFRIMNSAKTMQKGNILALRFAILQLPGVADVVYEDRAYGVGTARLVIQPNTITLNPTIMDFAQQVAKSEAPIGTNIVVEQPDILQVRLSVTINFRTGTTSDEQSRIVQGVTSLISSYINNLPINQPLLINQLAGQIIAFSPSKILSIGTPNKFFDYIYIYKTTKVGLVRKEVVSDVFIPDGLSHKFAVASFVGDPINVQ